MRVFHLRAETRGRREQRQPVYLCASASLREHVNAERRMYGKASKGRIFPALTACHAASARRCRFLPGEFMEIIMRVFHLRAETRGRRERRQPVYLCASASLRERVNAERRMYGKASKGRIFPTGREDPSHDRQEDLCWS